MKAVTIDLTDYAWQLKGYWPCEWELGGGDPFPPPGRSVTSWLETEVPGSIPAALLEAGLIEDPYRGMNSLKCEWVWQRDWVYRCRFMLDEATRRRAARLRFEGVDYACVVGLNGGRLGEHEGMFSPFAFDVSSRLRWGQENELWVAIREAPHEVSQIGRTEEVRTLKTRMNYKWDFATRLVNLGIWNPVYLDLFDRVRIRDLSVRTALSLDGSGWRARFSVRAELEVLEAGDYTFECEFIRAGERGASAGRQPAEQRPAELPCGAVTIEREFEVSLKAEEVWWPHSMGSPVLHEIELRIGEGNRVLARGKVRCGIRDIRFESVPDGPPGAPGYSLVVNGSRTLARGFNWVPIDHMYGPEYGSRYDQLTDRIVESGANMIRIWGGGLIEKDILYDLCDRKGILVWQDFIQSSSGLSNQPSRDAAFLAVLEKESLAAIRRLRNHPSLAVWCGGNELTGEGARPLTSEEPAIGLLERLVQEHDPGRYFLATNPTGEIFGLTPDALDRGTPLWDIHGPWQYQGDPSQYDLYNRNTAVFQSEFGAVGTANLETLRYVAPERALWTPHREHPLWVHHGAWWVHTAQVEEYFGRLESLDRYVESSQFLQAEAVRYAVEANRRRFPRFGGMLIWQLNEPWPNTACTNHVDYFGRPKMAYSFVQRAFRDVAVSLRYASIRIPADDCLPVEAFVSNLSASVVDRAFRIEALSPAGEIVAEHEAPSVRVEPGETRSVGRLDIKAPMDQRIVLCRVYPDREPADGSMIYVFSAQGDHPFAPLWALPPARLSVSTARSGRVSVTNAGPAVAFLVRIKAVGSETLVFPSHNFATLAPGQSFSAAVDGARVHGERVSTAGIRFCVWGWNTNHVRGTLE